MKHPAKTDIAVLLLFFTRSDTFAKVFEAVRQARPSKLLLYQDGPRIAATSTITRAATPPASAVIAGPLRWPTR